MALADPSAPLRARELRRLVALSAVLHLGGIALLGWVPASSWDVAPPEVIAVDLVVMPRAATPPRPAPPRPDPPRSPEPPRPAPAVAKVPVKKTVLPAESREPKPRAPEPKPRRRELDPSELPTQQPAAASYEDVLAQLRAEDDSAPPAPEPVVEAPSEASPQAGTAGARVDPVVAAWMRKTEIHVRRYWIVPPGFRLQPLETHVLVTLDSSGNVLGDPDIVRRSGNPWYDEGVIRGIRKASPLPSPPKAGDWPFVFTPEEGF